MDTTILRRIAACLLVGIYGALAGSLIGWAATFWMWGLGSIYGLVAGFCGGAIIGWKMPLRDAVILWAGCFGSLVALFWLNLALDLRSDIVIPGAIVIVIASWGLHRMVQGRLSLKTRYWLAPGLVAYLIINIVFLIGINP